jgi:dolichol-phosphate mannosyltransferase
VVQLSIVIPTYNEAANVAELVRRIEAALTDDAHLTPDHTEIIFVDDSTDDTPQEVERAAATSAMSVRCVHRLHATGGLSGAVIEGAKIARSPYCLVMDGDLQHPPERIGDLYARMRGGDVAVVVASRYAGGGNATGLPNAIRHGVSVVSTLVVKAMFPHRLHGCSDPMTGFFLFDTREVDLDELRPQGFKILLEILARRQLVIAEVPFEFAQRSGGESKASFRQGVHFLRHLVRLRFGRMSGFALIGALGALVNVALVWLLSTLGASVVASTLIAAEVTIIGNFLLQDRLVFGDLRARTHGFWGRFARSFAFNNVESTIRIALVVLLVNRGWMSATIATAVLLAFAFVLRYVFHALVVYAPQSRPRRRIGHPDHR